MLTICTLIKQRYKMYTFTAEARKRLDKTQWNKMQSPATTAEEQDNKVKNKIVKK